MNKIKVMVLATAVLAFAPTVSIFAQEEKKLNT